MGSNPLDLYCERVDPSFWAEPANALSNAAFLVAALAGFIRWRKQGGGDYVVLALIAVVAAVGLGSFAFHTLATDGALVLDVVPIGLFIYGYFLLALRRFLSLSWPLALALLIGFAALTNGLGLLVPRAVLNGSVGYFPALAALIAMGALIRTQPAGRAMLMAAAVFTMSLLFRIVDLNVCGAFPIGTHFLWHLLNAVVLYLLLRGAMVAATSPPMTVNTRG